LKYLTKNIIFNKKYNIFKYYKMSSLRVVFDPAVVTSDISQLQQVVGVTSDNGLQQDIQSINTTLDDHFTLVSGNITNISGLIVDVAKIDASLVDISGTLDQHFSLVSGNITNISGLKVDVAKIDASLVDISGTLDDHFTLVSGNITNISGLKVDVAKIDASLVDISGTLDDHFTLVSGNITNISGLKVDVAKIDASLVDIRESINDITRQVINNFEQPIAPDNYELPTGVKIVKKQALVRDVNKNQVDGLSLAYQRGISKDWNMELINEILDTNVVVNTDYELTYTGLDNSKNNLYASKKVSNVTGYGFNANVYSSSNSNNSVPIALAISLPDNSGNITNLDISLNEKQGETNIVLLQEASSNIVNVYAKEEGDDWYKNKNNVETTETEFTPSIINSSTTVSNIGLNTFFDGWDPIVYYSDTQWRLTTSGVDSWKNNMPDEYAAAGSPQAGHIADMVFYKNSPFLFGDNRRFLSSYLGRDVEPSVVPSNFITPLTDPNYDDDLENALDITVIGQLSTPITPTATSGLKDFSNFSVCQNRYGNDNNVKNIVRSTGSNSFTVDMKTNGRVPSLGALLLREPVGITWTVEFTIQMKNDNVLRTQHGWQSESADIYDIFYEDDIVYQGNAPYLPDTGFFFGALTDPNDKNSRSFERGVNKGKMLNMIFGGSQNNFMNNAPADPTRLDASLEAATIPTLATVYDQWRIKVESKPTGDATYPSAVRSSIYQDGIWKVIDQTSKSYVDNQGFGTWSTSGGYLGFQLESSSFDITDFTLTV
jgi:hypothetical protein